MGPCQAVVSPHSIDLAKEALSRREKLNDETPLPGRLRQQCCSGYQVPPLLLSHTYFTSRLKQPSAESFIITLILVPWPGRSSHHSLYVSHRARNVGHASRAHLSHNDIILQPYPSEVLHAQPDTQSYDLKGPIKPEASPKSMCHWAVYSLSSRYIGR